MRHYKDDIYLTLREQNTFKLLYFHDLLILDLRLISLNFKVTY